MLDEVMSVLVAAYSATFIVVAASVLDKAGVLP